MSDKKSLQKASLAKNDEFYTQLVDIENELRHYQKYFEDKIVLCNCDDPRISNFFHYFSYKFEKLKLKKLITTCYKSQKIDSFSQGDSDKAIKLEYDGDQNNNKVPDPDEIGIIHLESDGDFRSQECIDILKQADIVCTNPPFSLFREYVTCLIKHDKKFIIIGNKNAVSYKEIFKLIKENKVWIGVTPMSKDMIFDVPKSYANELVATKNKGSGYKIVDGVVKGRTQSVWFTNLDFQKRHENLLLYKKYSKTEYSKYDNYDAINVNKTKDIPYDYNGIMGVPITFIDKYNPDQFEIVGKMTTTKIDEFNYGYPYINGKKVYARILIKHKRNK